MSRRIDYYDDPNAPAITSMVPSVNVVVTNEAGDLLLIRRTDNDNWALPGGAMELGESLPQAAVREVQEESGVVCEITGLVGIYTDPRHVIYWTSNGEARQEFSIVLTAAPVSGELATSSESSEVRWMPRADLGDLPMHRTMRERIDHYMAEAERPYIQ
jgi:ADP-ribose pyrophosphatase YjhB (NUDIX family)